MARALGLRDLYLGRGILLWKHLPPESRAAKTSKLTTQPCWQSGNVPLHQSTDPEQPGSMDLWSHQYLPSSSFESLSIGSLLQLHSGTNNNNIYYYYHHLLALLSRSPAGCPVTLTPAAAWLCLQRIWRGAGCDTTMAPASQ